MLRFSLALSDNVVFRSYDYLPTPKRRVSLQRMNLKLQLMPGRHWSRAETGLGPLPVGRVPLDVSVNTAQSITTPQADSGEEANADKAIYNEGLDIDVHGLSVVSENFASDEDYGSRLLVIAKQVNAWDRLPASVVNQLLGDYVTESLPRETGSNMFRMEMVSVRTPGIVGDAAFESIVSLTLLPIRLNLDQDMLNFIFAFLSYSPASVGSSIAQLDKAWQDVRVNDMGELLVVSPPTDESASHGTVPSDGGRKAGGAADVMDVLSGSAAGTNSDLPSRSETTAQTGDDHREELFSSASTIPADTAASTPYLKLVKVSPVLLNVNYAPKKVSMSDLVHGDLQQLAGIISLTDAKLYLSPLNIKGE